MAKTLAETDKSVKELPDELRQRLKEGGLIGLVVLCAYLLLALFSYQPEDPGWSYIGPTSETANLMGKSGAWVSDVLLFIFGYISKIQKRINS